MKKSNFGKKYRKSEVRAGFILSLPFFLLFILFTVVPVLGSVVMSFTNFNMMSLPKFVGTENYIRLFLQDSSPEKNAERRINKGKSGLKIFLYHYKGIETADRMSYN